jgi:hypothetical protein
VLLATLGLAGTSCSDEPGSAPATTPANDDVTTVPSAPSGACPDDAPPPSTTGTFHTVVPGSAPVDFSVTVRPTTVCTGGAIAVAVRVRTTDGRPYRGPFPGLVVHGGNIGGWFLDGGPERLDASGDTAVTLHAIVDLPGVPPGSYSVGVYGYGGAAPIMVTAAGTGPGA